MGLWQWKAASPSESVSSSAKWGHSSPWFMKECVLNSQCRTAQSCLSGGVVTVIVTSEDHGSPSELGLETRHLLHTHSVLLKGTLPPSSPCLHPPPHFPHPPSCGRMRGQLRRTTKFIGTQRPGQCLSLGPCGRRMAVPSFPLGNSWLWALAPSLPLPNPHADGPHPQTHTHFSSCSARRLLGRV